MEKTNLTLGIINIACAFIVSVVSIPLIKEKVKMNHFYGVKFAKSYESEELWYKINKKGGQLLLLWSVVILFIGISCFIIPKIERPLLWLFGYAPVLYIIPAIQVYAYSKKL